MRTVNHTPGEEQSITWTELKSLFLRYRWLILATFTICLAAGWLTLQIFFTDLYETKSSLLVKIGRENAETPSTVVNGQVLSQGVRIQDINSEVQLLSSRALIETVVDKIGPETFKSVLKRPDSIWGYPKFLIKTVARAVKAEYKEFLIAANLKKRLTLREQAILAVGDGMKIEPVKESDVLTLKLRLPSAALCVQTANLLLTEYFETRAKVRSNDPGRSLFAKATSQRKAELEQLMDRRAEVRKAYDVSSPSEQRTIILKQLSDLTQEKTELELQIARLVAERQETQQRLSSMPLLVEKERLDSRNPALESLKDRITSLKMEHGKLLAHYLPAAEIVLKNESEIAGLEEILANEQQTIASSRTQQANPLQRELLGSLVQHDIQLRGLQSRHEQVTQPIAFLRAKLTALDKGSDSVEQADRDYRLAEQSYFAYFKRLAESRLAEELDSQQLANVSLISPPEIPIEPVYPPKMFIMGVLLPVGVLLGVVLAAFIESFDDRLHTEQDFISLRNVIFLGGMSAPKSESAPAPAAEKTMFSR